MDWLNDHWWLVLLAAAAFVLLVFLTAPSDPNDPQGAMGFKER